MREADPWHQRASSFANSTAALRILSYGLALLVLASFLALAYARNEVAKYRQHHPVLARTNAEGAQAANARAKANERELAWPLFVSVDKDFSAQLWFWGDAELVEAFNTLPDDQWRMDNLLRAVRGQQRVFVAILFSEPGLDANGAPDLAVFYQIRKPGETQPSPLSQQTSPAWTGRLLKPAKEMTLAKPTLEVRLGPDAPLGEYQVYAYVEDRVKGAKVWISNTFVLEAPATEKPVTPSPPPAAPAAEMVPVVKPPSGGVPVAR